MSTHRSSQAKADMIFTFLLSWTVIVVLWGVYSLLYDIFVSDVAAAAAIGGVDI